MKIMPEEHQPQFLTLVVPYALVVSLLYLFAYWSSFGINILQFVSFSDVIKLALYPIMIGAALSLSGLIFQVLV